VTVRYIRHPDMRLTALDAEGVVLHLGTRKYFSVSESGVDLLEALAQPRTMDELVSVMTAKFDVTDGQARESVTAFLEHSLKSGIITAEDRP
jgi:hypothetical protein